MNSTPAANTTALTPTNGGTLSTNGTNSNNKFYSNTINGGNAGIYLSGFAATVGVGPAPTATTFLGDLGNDVGGTGVSTFTNGNSILNFGGGAASNPAAGIRANNQWSLNVSNNTVNNNTGSGVNHATTLRGIYLQAGTSANVTCTYNNVTIKGGGTTSTVTAIDNGIGGTAASNTININNNTVSNCTYATATSGAFTCISNTASAANLNINNNTIQTNTLTGAATSAVFTGIVNTGSTGLTVNIGSNTISGITLAGTGTQVMISVGSPGGTANVTSNTIQSISNSALSGTTRGIIASTPVGLYSVTSNTIDGISYTAATSTGSIDGIYNNGSATLQNWNNNIIKNLSTPTTGAIRGIFHNTVTGTHQVKNNQVYNFSTTAGGAGGASFTGIASNFGTSDVSGNLVYSLNSTGSTGGSGGTITGLTISGTTQTVTNNAIYDLSSTSTNVVVTGINISGGTTNNLNNNLIGDLRATASTGLVSVSGITVAGGTTNNIFHNSVNIAATTASATTFGSSAIYFSSSTPVNNVRNNIFVNTSTPGPTGGFTCAIRYLVAPTSSNFPSTNNNNLYWVGTPSANKVIYGEASSTPATNGQQTIAAYKTYVSTTLAVAGREAASVSENPFFTSTAGSNPITTFLQYPTGTALQLEQGGGIGTVITTDFTGTTVRCPGGSCPGSAAAPDMGAWELNGTAADFTGPSISYTALSNTLCANGQSLTATITDASGVNTTAGTKPRIYFKKSTDANTYVGNTSADNGWKFVESSSSTSPFSFTMDASLLQTSLAAGDVIQYFVVAQDLATVPNVGVNSGTFAAAPSSVALTSAAFALTGTINSYTINTSIPTSVTIGAAGTYTSITGAGGLFAAINAGGLSGNTVATIIDASVTEDGSNALNQITYGCNQNVTLTIKPQTTATLSGSVSSGALIKLNGADYVTIDGSNSGGTDKSLTITNTSTTNPAGIWIGSLGTAAGAVNNTIKNCIINTNGGSIAIPVMIGSATTWGNSGDDNDNLIIQNNQLNSVNYGIYAFGNSTGVLDNLNISSNTISITSTLTAIFGIRLGRASGAVISGNTINATTSGATAPVAISIETGVANSSVTANQITGCTTTHAGGYGGRGITVGTGAVSSNITIANNFIAGVNGSNFSSFENSSSAGILIGVLGNGSTLTTTTGGVNIYHNNVNMAGSYSYATTCLTAGLYIGSGASALDIRNNILVNSMNNSNASGTTSKNYAIYSAVANTAFSNINYNDYFVSGSQGVLGFIGSDRIDLAALTAAFGGNANSMSINPQFVSSTDLHINSGTSQTVLESTGANVGVNTDFDGQTRPGPVGSTNGGGSAPDIGADEFDGVPLPQCTTPTVQASAVTITN
jgi:hypothetical protein